MLTIKVNRKCDWCGQTKLINPNRHAGKTFSCCFDCKNKLAKKQMKERWALSRTDSSITMGKKPLAPRIEMVCDNCGKHMFVTKSRTYGKKFFSCSITCRDILTRKCLKEHWDSMTPEQREERVRKITQTDDGHEKGFKAYWTKHNEKMVLLVATQLMHPKVIMTTRERKKANLSTNTCVMLKAHARVMREDPERLTSEFCQQIINKDCGINDKNETNL